MNTRTITRVKRSTKIVGLMVAGTLSLFAGTARAEWSVDFSRRLKPSAPTEWRAPAGSSAEYPIDAEYVPVATPLVESHSPAATDLVEELNPPPTLRDGSDPAAANSFKSPGLIDQIFRPEGAASEIVLLNTERGFVPSTIRVKKGVAYDIHVVNVNDKEKNVSFVLDSFSEHHATYYGKVKTFTIRPAQEGVFRFVSPETSAQGKLVVFPAANDTRLPAAVE